MPSQFSHDLPPLSVSGNKIVNTATQEPVRLRGINRSGLQYAWLPDFLGSVGLTEDDMEQIVNVWGANIVRIPFNQEMVLPPEGFDRNEYDPDAYLTALDTVIERAARRGAYTLLDLQWLNHKTVRGIDNNGQPNFVAPLPNLKSLEVWPKLGLRYREEPAVLFDIFNEPHDPLPNDRLPLLGINDVGVTFEIRSRKVTMKEWQPWARELVLAIRTVHPDALIFVPGINWAYNLEGHPLPGMDGLVYSTHVYKDKAPDEDSWEDAFGELAENVPVFAGEWGGDDTQWGQALADYLEKNTVGWTAWSWNNDPFLIQQPVGPPWTPTEFGKIVYDRLRR